jgi:hypothetical protein
MPHLKGVVRVTIIGRKIRFLDMKSFRARHTSQPLFVGNKILIKLKSRLMLFLKCVAKRVQKWQMN